MIEFKQDAYESLDTVLTALGEGEYALGARGIGFAVQVTPVDSDPFDAFIVGPVLAAWWDDNRDFDGDVVYDKLASWPVLVRRMKDGYPDGDEFVVIARKLVVL